MEVYPWDTKIVFIVLPNGYLKNIVLLNELDPSLKNRFEESPVNLLKAYSSEILKTFDVKLDGLKNEVYHLCNY